MANWWDQSPQDALPKVQQTAPVYNFASPGNTGNQQSWGYSEKTGGQGGGGGMWAGPTGATSTNPSGNDAAPNWGSYGGNPVRPISDQEMKGFYTPGIPGNQYQSYLNQVGQQLGGMSAPWESFWQSHYDDMLAQYYQAAEQNKNLMLPDWLTGDVAQKFKAMYELQAPQARGIDPRLYDRGRFDTSY